MNRSPKRETRRDKTKNLSERELRRLLNDLSSDDSEVIFDAIERSGEVSSDFKLSAIMTGCLVARNDDARIQMIGFLGTVAQHVKLPLLSVLSRLLYDSSDAVRRAALEVMASIPTHMEQSENQPAD